MIDFGKKLREIKVEKPQNPVDIYESLDRTTEAGPLREVQKDTLNEWYNNHKNDKDLIIKLHTGEGKTLIGLLILQSVLNIKEGPAIYVCPTKNLAEQVMREANKFGMPYCTISESYLPPEYENGDKILISYVQKVFNGRTIFGRAGQSIPFGCCILDDSHACIDAIQDSFTIKIPCKCNAYGEIKLLFKDSLEGQGEGSFLELNNSNSSTIMQIPYWSWLEKQHEIVTILNEYAEEEEGIKFSWPLLKDHLAHCHAFISSNMLEITPNYLPIEKFSFFDKAIRRILMSATTQNDEFFIKGLHFSIKAIQNPIQCSTHKWSGEKMILIPSLIDEKLGRHFIISTFSKNYDKRKYGCVAIAPSYYMADDYNNEGAIVSTKCDINKNVSRLRSGQYDKMIVLVNRYDGIDLPDNSCRILIIDSLPFSNSLSERYEMQCRENSEIMNLKIAQKIEQGIGRSVRGEKDYSAIILIGSDLVKFVMSRRTSSFFSQQTQKQIELGLEIAEDAKIEAKEGKEYIPFVDLLKLFLSRDLDWKEYYKRKMDSIIITPKVNKYEIIESEFLAAKANFLGNHTKACNYIRDILNIIPDESEKGWYQQQMAYYTYFDSRDSSIKIQTSAFEKNTNLLKPESGILYKKISNKSATQLEKILKVLKKFGTYQELRLYYDKVLNDFSFGMSASKFEQAVMDIGFLLGFDSQRPDNEIRKGPDNLWGGVKDTFFLIECKSEVNTNRNAISKEEAGQMCNHCGWFESEYGKEHNVKRILIIPTRTLAKNANFTHNVEVMDIDCLQKFKDKLSNFIKEFKLYELGDMTLEKIHDFLVSNKLSIEDLLSGYTKKYIKEK